MSYSKSFKAAFKALYEGYAAYSKEKLELWQLNHALMAADHVWQISGNEGSMPQWVKDELKVPSKEWQDMLWAQYESAQARCEATKRMNDYVQGEPTTPDYNDED